MRHHTTGRRSHIGQCIGAACCLIGGISAIVLPASSANAAPSPKPKTNTTTPAPAPTPAGGISAATAHTQALLSGKPVVATALTTPTQQTTANPDGSYTLHISAQPTRIRQNGGWVPLDATLQRNTDGSYSPKATPSGLTLSGGGNTAMATLSASGASLTLSWPTILPTPTVSGSQLDYIDVLPGVDLDVTADAEGGFSDVLVVRTAEGAANPALANLTMGYTTHGLTLHADAAGNLTTTDTLGAAVFTAPAPQMWDSATPVGTAAQTRAQAITRAGIAPATSTTTTPGAAANVTPVGVAVGPDTLTLTPSPALLADPQLPLFIDPAWAGADSKDYPRGHWTYTDQSHPTTSHYNSSDDAKLGYDGWDSPFGIRRSYFQFNLSSTIWGSNIDIIDAKLQTDEEWSAQNSTGSVSIYHTGAISSSTTWNNAPSKGARVGQNTNVPADWRSDETHLKKQVDFDITPEIVNASAGSWTTDTVGMFNDNETDKYQWRQFDNNPNLAITYNAKPTVANPHTSPATSCDGSGSPVPDTTLTLMATLNDADASNSGSTKQTSLTADYVVTDQTNPAHLSTTSYQVTVTAGSVAALPFLSSALYDGDTYTWKVRAYDGKDYSAYTTTCHFTIDHTAPLPPVVDAPNQSDCSLETLAPRSDPQFTFTPGNPADPPADYVYSVNVPPPASLPVGGPFPGAVEQTNETGGSPQPVNIADPRPAATNELYVYALDAAGNPSGITDCVFETSALTSPDPTGDLTGDGHPDLLSAGTNGATTSGLWLYPGTGTGAISSTATNIGPDGISAITNPAQNINGTSSDFNGTSITTADFNNDGLQDVLVRLPVEYPSGNLDVIYGTGDGLPLDSHNPAVSNSLILTDSAFNPLNVDQIVATPDPDGQPYPDLYAVIGDSLYQFEPLGVALAYSTPTYISSGWTEYTLIQAPDGTTPAIMARNNATGAITMGTISGTTVTVTNLTGATLTATSTPTIIGTDYDTDATPDLWAGGNGTIKPYHNSAGTLTAGTAITGGNITTIPATPATHELGNWPLADLTGTDFTNHDPITTINGSITNPAGTDPSGNTYNSFDGATAQELTQAPSVITNESFTVAAWIDPAVISSTATHGYITAVSQDGTQAPSFQLQYRYNMSRGPSWCFTRRSIDAATGNPNLTLATACGGTPTANTWVQLVGVYDATTGTNTLYINGIAAGSTTMTATWTATGPINIGSRLNGTSTYADWFDGNIDQVQTFNGALTAAQVNNLYQHGNPYTN